ncbi:interferon-induced protein 44-like [Mugil cephalus]|uniref:interferon-induced protein 44-like n=1 Tax=Mugil cephalus TaxID=48193 RepID=UPI001FB82FDC|nr:interferon-induced protein 44-like [Mugil cephalus]
MGGEQSKPEPVTRTVYVEKPAPPPPPMYDEPWRVLPWGNNISGLNYVKDYQPQNDEVKFIRVLLYGPVGAGKSSFISSVSTVLRRRIATPAKASSTTSDQSYTKKYKTHKIPKEGRGNFYPFVFNDIMGLEDGSGRGVSVEDIKLIMKGHVKDGYKFNPVSPLSPGDPHYNPSPSMEDRIHVLVCVQSANAQEIQGSVLQKLKDIREAASDLDIPQIAVITKIDEATEETERDLRNVYKSKHVKKKMTDLSAFLGIPMNCIFPVKNYSEETDLKDDLDTLILSALKLILDLGDDFTCDM